MSTRTFARWNKLAGLESRYSSKRMINENRTKDDLEAMDNSRLIEKMAEKAEELKKDDGKRFPNNLKAEAKMAEGFMSIVKKAAEEGKFNNAYDGIVWMRDNACGIIEEQLKGVNLDGYPILQYAATRAILDEMLKPIM